ncbi:MAG: hypothetical protein AAGC70_05885 [Pseudomonadota bacterium]
MSSMRLIADYGRVLIALAIVASVTAVDTARAEPKSTIAVDVKNLSEPVLCAEKDNVAVAFTSERVRKFRIEAAHPAYLPGLSRDSIAADWTNCDFSADPAFKSEVKVPTRRTLYEEPALWVVGWTFPTFWRPSTAKVRIGTQTFEGLHLIQVWMIRPMGGEEVLVLYPQDGYWRIRPKAPTGRDLTAFGSSVLIGPVEDAGRPIVALDTITFEPKAKQFKLTFQAGGSATVKMSDLNTAHHRLDVTFDQPVTGRPFAMVRSMYVTAFNNDAARVAVRPENGQGWQEHGILSFKSARAKSVWIGRTTPSRHNTSAPDTVFNNFEAAGP